MSAHYNNKRFFLSYQCLTKSVSPISKGYFFASPLNLCLSAYVAEHWLTDTLSIHLFFCVGVQSNTLSRLWFLEGNKNPTQLNLTWEDIKNVSFSLWIQLIKLLAALPVFYSYNQGYANKWIIKLLNTWTGWLEEITWNHLFESIHSQLQHRPWLRWISGERSGHSGFCDWVKASACVCLCVRSYWNIKLN